MNDETVRNWIRKVGGRRSEGGGQRAVEVAACPVVGLFGCWVVGGRKCSSARYTRISEADQDIGCYIRKSDVRRQRSEVGGRRAEVRGRRSKGAGQRGWRSPRAAGAEGAGLTGSNERCRNCPAAIPTADARDH